MVVSSFKLMVLVCTQGGFFWSVQVGLSSLEMESLELRVKILSEKAKLPERATSGSAGYDLFAAHDAVIPGRSQALVGTDVAIAVPEGHYGRIAPRSGLALKHFVDVGAGVIDPDYRGKVGVVLFNHSKYAFVVNCGDRIAQLIIEKIVVPPVVSVQDLDETARGDGGFGSTGIQNFLLHPPC